MVCPDPGEPPKGKRLSENFQEGQTVTFKCNRDHDLVGNDTIRCEGGMWSGDVPKCKGESNLRPLFTITSRICADLYIMALTTISLCLWDFNENRDLNIRSLKTWHYAFPFF